MMKTPVKVSTTNDHTKLPCKIIQCVCKHPEQDGMYGRFYRVYNPGKGSIYSCTVCGAKKAA